MYVGVCRLTLLASHSHSLKEKRAVIRKVKDRVRARFQVPLSEVGGQDTWQMVVLGFALASSDRGKVARLLEEIVRFVAEVGDADLTGAEREILGYGAGELGSEAPGWWARGQGELQSERGDQAGSLADESWIPDSWKNDDDDKEVR